MKESTKQAAAQKPFFLYTNSIYTHIVATELNVLALINVKYNVQFYTYAKLSVVN